MATAKKERKPRTTKIAAQDKLKLAQVNEFVTSNGGTVTAEVTHNKEAKNWSTESTLNGSTVKAEKSYGVVKLSIAGGEPVRVNSIAEVQSAFEAAGVLEAATAE